MQQTGKKLSLAFLFTGTLLMALVMAKTGASLKTPVTPKGILDLEFAYNTAKASLVLHTWTGTGASDHIRIAKINTRLDFIFLFFYSLFLYRACSSIATSSTGLINYTGRFLAKAALAAGIFDVLENMGMLISLEGYLSDTGTMLTFIFSAAKWMTALAAAGFILLSGPVIWSRGTSPKERI